MFRRHDTVRDFSFLNVHVQQQVHDLLNAVDQQRQTQALPRVDSVRGSKVTSGGGQSGVALQLGVTKKNPQSYTGAEEQIEITIRVSNGFPAQSPMVVCTAGTEKLPQSLLQDGQLDIPWLRDGWPNGYSLSAFVADLCAALKASPVVHCAPIHPLRQEMNQDDHKQLQPSAPTLHTSSGFEAIMDLPLSKKSITFQCKWQKAVCQFTAPVPESVAKFLLLAKALFPALPDPPGIRLRVFRSPTESIVITSDKVNKFASFPPDLMFDVLTKRMGGQDWCFICASDNYVVYILFEDAITPRPHLITPSPSSPARSNAIPTSMQPRSTLLGNIVHPDCHPRVLAWSELAIDKCVGVGSSCRVYKGAWRGTEIAVKNFTGMNRAAVEREFANEVEMMERLGAHPSLVLLVGVCVDPLAIVFEYLPFSLFELINGVPDRNRRVPPFPTSWTKRVSMMLDVARGLQFLHSFNIIHRDLKSLNLMVTAEGRVKLADFGISRVAKQSEAMTGCCGTFQWMAPEVITRQQYSLPADIYSFGVILWEICEASAPFADLPPASIPITVVAEKKRPPISQRTPQPLQHLIRRCWQEEPSLRPTAAEVVNTLIGYFPKQ